VKGIQYYTVVKVFNIFNLKKNFQLMKFYAYKTYFILIFSKFLIEKKLDYFVLDRIKFKKEIGSYQGYRHELKLPCRGQGTKRNGKTNKPKSAKRKKKV
jgi:ribosomal protein S13